MLLYILLILGQVFANQQMADKVYRCVDTMARARSSSNSNFTIQEVADSCSEQVSAGKIKIEEARLDAETNHTLKVSWIQSGKKIAHLYSFNIVGTKLCNEPKKNLKNLLLDINAIMNNTQNSRSANTCSTDQQSYGFGFKSVISKGKISCQRICPEGEVLVGMKVPIYFEPEASNEWGKTGSMKKRNTAFNGETFESFDEQFMETKCTSCLTLNPDDAKYSKTSKDDNKCYDKKGGCPEGHELFEGNDESEYILTLNQRPQHNNKGKLCRKKCELHESLRENGTCTNDPAETCKTILKIKKNAENWLERFAAAARSNKLENCNMTALVKRASTWVKYISEKVDIEVKDKCKQQTDYLHAIFELTSFASSPMFRVSSELKACSPRLENSNKKIDVTLHSLMHEWITPMTYASMAEENEVFAR